MPFCNYTSDSTISPCVGSADDCWYLLTLNRSFNVMGSAETVCTILTLGQNSRCYGDADDCFCSILYTMTDSPM